MTGTIKDRIAFVSFVAFCILLLVIAIAKVPILVKKESQQLEIPYTMICSGVVINNVRRSQGNVYLDNKRIYPGADCTFIPEKGTNQ